MSEKKTMRRPDVDAIRQLLQETLKECRGLRVWPSGDVWPSGGVWPPGVAEVVPSGGVWPPFPEGASPCAPGSMPSGAFPACPMFASSSVSGL